MFKSSLCRSFLVAAIALVLMSSVASAAPSGWSLGSDLGRTAWSLLLGEWTPRSSGLTPKLGCTINPNGSPRCAPAPKAGCNINPNGSPVCGPAPKAGCTISPDGSPGCTS